MPLAEAIPFIIKVLAKSMDTSLSPDKVELATVTREPDSGKVGWVGWGIVVVGEAAGPPCVWFGLDESAAGRTAVPVTTCAGDSQQDSAVGSRPNVTALIHPARSEGVEKWTSGRRGHLQPVAAGWVAGSG